MEEEPSALVQKGHIGNSFIKSIFEANPRQISKPGKWKRSSSLVVSFPSWSHHTQKSNEKKATSFPLLPQPPPLYYHKHSPGEAQGREVPGKRNKRSGIALCGRGIAKGTSNRCRKARPLVTASAKSIFSCESLCFFLVISLPYHQLLCAQQDVRGGNRCDAVFVIQRQRQKKSCQPRLTATTSRFKLAAETENRRRRQPSLSRCLNGGNGGNIGGERGRRGETTMGRMEAKDKRPLRPFLYGVLFGAGRGASEKSFPCLRLSSDGVPFCLSPSS